MQTTITKNIIRLAAITAALLLIPLVAMQFTSEVNWDETDFIVMGTLIFSIGLAFILIAQTLKSTKARFILAFTLGTAFFLIWAELAVGIFGSPFAGS